MPSTIDITKEEILRATANLEHTFQIPVKRSWGALFIATIEAVCLFVVTAARAGTVLGSVLGSIAGGTVFLHGDVIRIPVLLLAIGGSIFNLSLLLRSYRLRNAPGAMWRKKPLTARQRWKIVMVLILSILTFIVAGSEIYLHRLLKHTIM